MSRATNKAVAGAVYKTLKQIKNVRRVLAYAEEGDIIINGDNDGVIEGRKCGCPLVLGAPVRDDFFNGNEWSTSEALRAYNGKVDLDPLYMRGENLPHLPGNYIHYSACIETLSLEQVIAILREIIKNK